VISTHSICQRTGIYRSSPCGEDVVGRAGTSMPVCPKCGQETEWQLVAGLSPMVRAPGPADQASAPPAAGTPRPRPRREGADWYTSLSATV